MFPSAPPPKSPCPICPQIVCTIYPSLHPPKIAKSNLPSNRQVRFTLKSSVQFTPPPRNRQVQFTLKLPSPINPQIVCTICAPSKSPSPIYPQIAKSDLPSRFTPPKSPSPIYPQIAKSDLPPQIVCMIYPPQIAKSDLPSNHQVQFTLKSSVRFTPPLPLN